MLILDKIRSILIPNRTNLEVQNIPTTAINQEGQKAANSIEASRNEWNQTGAGEDSSYKIRRKKKKKQNIQNNAYSYVNIRMYPVENNYSGNKFQTNGYVI